MDQLAVDIVLLPEDHIARDCVALNAKLVSAFASEIVLNAETCLPHVSLAMGCMAQEALPEIAARLQHVLGDMSPAPFECAGIQTTDHGQGRLVSSVDLVKTASLQAFHERVMTDLAPLLHREAEASMLHGDEPIAPSTLQWIRSYREHASFAAFSPHITLGYGRLEGEPFPTQFPARSLAVCHLGNHCTCRRVLWETEIGNQ